MRAIIAVAIFLCACGQPSAPPTSSEAENAADVIPTGSFIANGENPDFEFIADTTSNVMDLRMDYESVATAPYVAPQPNGEGARIVSGDMTVDLVPERCTALGVTYPLRITVHARGNFAVTGCGVERWDARLLELMPYIDACLAKSPQTRRITYAGDIGEGVTVRMWGDDAQQDCVVQRDAMESAVVAQRREELKIPGESAAIFMRGPGENAGGECYDAPEVRSASGEVLGWMLDPLGC